jgi:hypothetical protein
MERRGHEITVDTFQITPGGKFKASGERDAQFRRLFIYAIEKFPVAWPRGFVT